MDDNAESQKAFTPANENRSFVDVLKSLLGETVTMVNPQSYEDAPHGHQIRAGFYRAKLVGLGHDYLIVVAEYVHADNQGSKEPAKQYIPVDKIKRISLTKSEQLIHI